MKKYFLLTALITSLNLSATTEPTVNIHAKNKSGRTQLHLAARSGNLESVKLLLEAGADVNARDILGKTPLYVAAEKGHLEIAILLLDAGVYINARDIFGKTPLHAAADSDTANLEVVKLLINIGADVNAQDSSGKTPLDYAALRGHEIVVPLIYANAHVTGRHLTNFKRANRCKKGLWPRRAKKKHPERVLKSRLSWYDPRKYL